MSNNKKTIFIGGIVEGEKRNYKSKGILLSSADVLQRNILDGLIANDISDLEIVNSAFVGTFPSHCNQLFIKGQELKYKNSIKMHDSAFINFPIVNEISRGKSIYSNLKSITDKEDNVDVIVYSLLIRNLIAIKKYSKYNPKAKFYLIVTDMPEFMAMNNDGIIRNIYHKFMNYWVLRLRKYSDFAIKKCIFLTKHMHSVLYSDKPYIVIEGMINSESISESGCETVNSRHILYTGGLEVSLGVRDMVEAFEKIEDPSLKLDIAGDGALKSYIEEKSRQNKNIIYHGRVPYEKAIELQRRTEILISPTQNNGTHSLYAFPAKLIEYLLTGNKVISRKLPGIPHDYYKFLFVPESDSVESLKQCIEKTVNTIRTEHGREVQRTYIITNKNNIFQTRRIIDFINSN